MGRRAGETGYSGSQMMTPNLMPQTAKPAGQSSQVLRLQQPGLSSTDTPDGHDQVKGNKNLYRYDDMYVIKIQINIMMNINSFANRYSREDHSHQSTWAINCMKRPWEDMTELDIDINPYLSIYLSI